MIKVRGGMRTTSTAVFVQALMLVLFISTYCVTFVAGTGDPPPPSPDSPAPTPG